MLDPGDPAPQVAAPNQHGDRVDPAFAAPTVVFFYPEDGSPGCTTEADQFDREADAYADAGVTVYGVSTDTVESHRAFAADLGIGFDLLADPEGEVAAAFGLDLAHDGTAPRTTFVLADGEVHRAYEGVNPDGHARNLLLDLLEDGLVTLE